MFIAMVGVSVSLSSGHDPISVSGELCWAACCVWSADRPAPGRAQSPSPAPAPAPSHQSHSDTQPSHTGPAQCTPGGAM